MNSEVGSPSLACWNQIQKGTKKKKKWITELNIEWEMKRIAMKKKSMRNSHLVGLSGSLEYFTWKFQRKKNEDYEIWNREDEEDEQKMMRGREEMRIEEEKGYHGWRLMKRLSLSEGLWFASAEKTMGALGFALIEGVQWK